MDSDSAISMGSLFQGQDVNTIKKKRFLTLVVEL